MPQLVARGLTIDIDRPMIMAVINATPDSFSDAGKYATVEARMERTREVLAQGADILDIGGQSAITGVPEIFEDEEIERITPVIEWVGRTSRRYIRGMAQQLSLGGTNHYWACITGCDEFSASISS